MAKATKEDCLCLNSRGSFSIKEGHEDPTRIYVARCPWHKGPDAGYGYDSWGRPNSKHSKAVGEWGAGIVIGVCLIGILGIGLWLAFRW